MKNKNMQNPAFLLPFWKKLAFGRLKTAKVFTAAVLQLSINPNGDASSKFV